ncbi:MAG: response regulator transcription factor [Polyangiaceae bacterium]
MKLLIVDDDKRLYELLQGFLAQNGVTSEHAADGRQGLSMLARGAYDAVLLDVMMPGMDGLEVLKRIREDNSIPVIMLTAKGDETDRVVGLELGADDYLPKPFSPRELLARVRAVLRRVRNELGDERLCIDGLVVFPAERRAELDGEWLELTGLELDLLVALMRRPGRVIPRGRLLDEAGRSDVAVGERTVDVHVSHLRKKLGSLGKERIRTVRGVGYVFAANAVGA